jgi:Mg-chelatase subunit ChlD
LATIRVRPAGLRTLAARLGRVVAGRRAQFMRLELDVAPRLAPLPRRLSVVFVLDASHSVGPELIRQQLRIARAYLAHVPDARFEIVLFRRQATRVVKGFAAARGFDRLVTRARRQGRLAPGNGSHLERGLRAAAHALSTDRALGRTPRIVVLSDGLLRPGWRNVRALAALARAPRGTVVHVVLPLRSPGEPVRERRDDGHPLAPIAARHGGVLLHIEGLPGRRPQALRRVTLGLVRPTRIDGVRVRGLDGAEDLEIPHRLPEGSGVRALVLSERAPRRLVITGRIWARRLRRVIRSRAGFSRSTAAFVFGLAQHEALSRAQMLRVARLGRAVSPVTSYLAIEPGVRPSTAGLSRVALGAGLRLDGGTSRFDSSSMGGWGHGGATGAHLTALLRRPLARCTARHRPAPGWQVSLRVETTIDEVVDVKGRGAGGPMQRCVREAVWKLRLPPTFTRPRDTFNVKLPGLGLAQEQGADHEQPDRSGRRSIAAGCVAPPLRTPGTRHRRALPAARLARQLVELILIRTLT